MEVIVDGMLTDVTQVFEKTASDNIVNPLTRVIEASDDAANA